MSTPEMVPQVIRSVAGPGGGRIRTIEDAPGHIPGKHARPVVRKKILAAIRRYNQEVRVRPSTRGMLEALQDGGVHYFLYGMNGSATGVRFDDVTNKFNVSRDPVSVTWTAFARAILETPQQEQEAEESGEITSS